MQIHKFFWLTLIMMQPITAMSQTDTIFKCPEFYEDLKAHNACNGTPKPRAQKIMALNHMNEDKEIQYQYVIPVKDSIDVEQFMSTVKNWGNVTFNKPDESLKSSSATMVEYEATFPNVAVNSGYMKYTTISASMFVRIDAKPDRIRITGRIKHYLLAQGSLAGPKSVLTLPGDVYPFKESSNEQSYAMAFINSNAKVQNIIYALLNYINENYNKQKEKEKEDEDW